MMTIRVFDHMEECTEAEVQRLLPTVPEWRQKQALQFRHVHGQYCCLKSWAMLQEILSELHMESAPLCCPTDWEVGGTPEGKPFFVAHPEVQFSISHCKEGIAVAVDDRLVGIDIESTSRRTLFEPEDGTDFYTWWTRMEALVKMRGTGITDQWRETRPETGEMVETYRPEGKKYIYSVAYTDKNQ